MRAIFSMTTISHAIRKLYASMNWIDKDAVFSLTLAAEKESKTERVRINYVELMLYTLCRTIFRAVSPFPCFWKYSKSDEKLISYLNKFALS